MFTFIWLSCSWLALFSISSLRFIFAVLQICDLVTLYFDVVVVFSPRFVLHDNDEVNLRGTSPLELLSRLSSGKMRNLSNLIAFRATENYVEALPTLRVIRGRPDFSPIGFCSGGE